MERSVLEDPTLDTFAKQVLSTLEPEVFASLSPKQYAAFRHTLERARPIRRHAVNIRGILPLGVACYYFVLLAGRDRRDGTRHEEQELWRTMSSILGTVVLASVLLLLILSAILLMGYGIKSFLGIDLDPNMHLIDYLR